LAVRDYARDVLRLKRMVAITLPENHDSICVLEKIGMRFEMIVRFAEDGEELKLFGCDF
jgi:RimJ/RimL family protein N-acetyltransferase